MADAVKAAKAVANFKAKPIVRALVGVYRWAFPLHCFASHAWYVQRPWEPGDGFIAIGSWKNL